MATFTSSMKAKLIYVFAINDEAHADCLKIGETTLEEDNGEEITANCELLNRAAHKRIRQYTKTAGIAYELLYTDDTVFRMSGMVMTFNDKQVHKVLERSGVKKKVFPGVDGADEWYCCDLATVKKAIQAVKHGEQCLLPGDVTTNMTPIILRREQRDAVDRTKKRLAKSGRMLWNAKMRFGKTLAALQLIKEENYKRTLIITHRPVVDSQWFDEFNKVFCDRDDFKYGSLNAGEGYEKLESSVAIGLHYIYFASIQNLRGSAQVGGKFEKNEHLFSTRWDFIIIDEAHEGTKTELGQSVIEQLEKPGTKELQLSGTPYNLFDDYDESDIFTWDYVMEQQAKQAWEVDNPYVPNPYISLPAINIYTYDLGTLMTESDYIEDERAFNFREFFRTKDDGTFVHNSDVDRFLDLLCKDDRNSLYPFSNDKFRRIFRHTLWLVPGVKAARALSTKLQRHRVFGLYEVVNVAGDGDEDQETTEALKAVNSAIGPDPDETYTITLSCGRLTTGVSVKPWTGVFMLSGSYSTSAAQYMQTIFRVQTPYENHGRMKEECYAFDFAPDRTLRVLAEAAKVSTKAGKQTDEDRKLLGDFLNFCPIISIEGGQMKPYDVNKMMSQLKRAQIEKVVQCGFEDGALYNDELLKLTEVDLKDFADLQKTIGKTKAMAKSSEIDINNQGYDKEQYEEIERLKKKPKKELSEEEKKRLEEDKKKQDNRRNAISILRGVSIRMPLLIYGAELKNEDEEITLDNFTSLIDPQSWEEFMPKDVTKDTFNLFKKYYDPDIFREAGKRIREMARAADKFTIEERIERISAIFNTFRNPDKETVLTPWRVVNMHMSDCLGGWCFYDEEFKQTFSVPRFVDQGEVTKEVFRPEAHVLEINSKSGLYPLYVAYNIYRSRVEAAKAKYGEVGHGFAMQLWDATIEENILVVCKTPMAKSITKRTLAGFRDTRVNAQYYPNLIENISERPEAVVNTFRDGKRFWKINDNTNMKLDAIVSNPPYQEMNGGGGGSSDPVYNKFVGISKKMNPNYISFIIPARWTVGGRFLDEFRSEMIKDKYVTKFYDYFEPRDIFPQVAIEGGICYFLRSQKEGKCDIQTKWGDGTIHHSKRYLEHKFAINNKEIALDVFVRDEKAVSIIEKVLRKNTFTPFSTLVKPRNYYKLDTMPKEATVSIDNIGIWGLDRTKNRVMKYIKEYEVPNDEFDINMITKWKVFVSKADGAAGQLCYPVPARIIGATMRGGKNIISTITFLVIGPFNSEIEAENVQKYMKTKFFRFLLGVRKLKNVYWKNFSFIPCLDFTKEWSDVSLYQEYDLSPEEQNHIESMIMPME